MTFPRVLTLFALAHMMALGSVAAPVGAQFASWTDGQLVLDNGVVRRVVTRDGKSRGFFEEQYEGAAQFYAMLERWRKDDRLDGLELS